MSTISPGPASNSAMSVSVQHEQRASSPESTGRIVTQTAGANASTAGNTFEHRATESGIQH